MNLNELKQVLGESGEKSLRIVFPDGSSVPPSFHVTEVGRIDKTFIDCGGKIHSQRTCQLQLWLGPDDDHRLSSVKLLGILNLAAKIMDDDSREVEIEYEGTLISQFPLQSATVEGDVVTLSVGSKHTDCLAKELCLLPMASGGDCGCGPSGCC